MGTPGRGNCVVVGVLLLGREGDDDAM